MSDDAPSSDRIAGSTCDTPAVVESTPAVVEVRDLDWQSVRDAADPHAILLRMQDAVASMESLLDAEGGPGMLFDKDRAHAADRVPRVSADSDTQPLWVIGDLHGDLLALEAAVSYIQREARASGLPARLVFLGDFIDDEGFGLEVLVRVFELIVAAPELVCVIAGNHDEALSFDGTRFTSSVSPGDFSDFLNENSTDEWIGRAAKVALRLTAHAARALFLPDGLLIAHGGFPLIDLHSALAETGEWNAPECLSDFVWARAHPKARRKLPNRYAKGSQFGYEDFADFCALSERLGRKVTHFVRGHDHVEARYAIYPAYRAHPVLTTVALSRRLPREVFGPFERAPTIVYRVPGSPPQVHQLFPPSELIHALFPPPVESGNTDITA